MDESIRLSWRERIGFCSGEFALNIIYQTVSFWLLFFYTNVFGLRPEVAAVMFLVVRIVDIVWDPVVGTLVDKARPRWGKYRSWLIFGGVPLAGAAILCFWNGFSGSLLYAYITYVGLSMCFTLISVPYGAMHSSMTRNSDEITIINSVRMICANLAAIAIKALPLIIAIFAPKVYNASTGRTEAVYNTPEAAGAWFITMSIFALTGLAIIFFCFSQSREHIVMSKQENDSVKVSDLWMELVRNRPLRILSLFFIIAFTTMSIDNAADSYFLTYNVGATPLMTSVFMWTGTLPAFIFLPMVPAIKRKVGKKGMFFIFIGVSLLGMLLMHLYATIPALKAHFVLLCITQFIKSSGIAVATGYMWALVPDVVSYGEYLTGKRVSGIVNALICIFMKGGMALGGVIPGLVLAWVGFNAGNHAQTPLAEQGIVWLETAIPAILMIAAAVVIGRYELSDERMDRINSEIEKRRQSI